jgi:hypothetical protein
MWSVLVREMCDLGGLELSVWFSCEVGALAIG